MPNLFSAIVKIKSILNDWEKWAKRISEAARKILGHCAVFAFGSVVEGKHTGGSDLDILIVVDEEIPHKRRAEIIAKIEEEAGLPLYHPIEIHLVDRKEFQWYMRHIKEYKKI